MEEKSRRNFLKKGLMGTGLLATGCGLSEHDHTHGDEEKVEVLGVNGEIMEVSQSDLHAHAAMVDPNLDPRQGIEGRKFVMVIDLGKCKNARKCVTACQKMHYTPDKE